jgi:hypothetical protein
MKRNSPRFPARGWRQSALLVALAFGPILVPYANLQAQDVDPAADQSPQLVYTGQGIQLKVQRLAPGLGTQGVGWLLINQTNDSLEVDLVKTFYTKSGREVKTTKGNVLAKPGQTVKGARFLGDDIFALWDDFFFGDAEDLRKSERIGNIKVSVTVKNISEQRRIAAREQNQRNSEKTKQAFEELDRELAKARGVKGTAADPELEAALARATSIRERAGREYSSLGAATEDQKSQTFESLQQELEAARRELSSTSAGAESRIQTAQAREEARRDSIAAARREANEQVREAKREGDEAVQQMAQELSQMDVGEGSYHGQVDFGFGLSLPVGNTDLGDHSGAGYDVRGGVSLQLPLTGFFRVGVSGRAGSLSASSATLHTFAETESYGTDAPLGSTYGITYYQADLRLWLGPIAIGAMFDTQSWQVGSEETGEEVEYEMTSVTPMLSLGSASRRGRFILSGWYLPTPNATFDSDYGASIELGMNMFSFGVTYFSRELADPSAPIRSASNTTMTAGMRIPF